MFCKSKYLCIHCFFIFFFYFLLQLSVCLSPTTEPAGALASLSFFQLYLCEQVFVFAHIFVSRLNKTAAVATTINNGASRLQHLFEEQKQKQTRQFHQWTRSPL